MVLPLALAGIVASILPQALPYLLKLGGARGDSLVEEAKTKFGPEAWETSRSIWSKIGERLLNKPAGKEAVDDVVNHPKDEGYQDALKNQIRKVLEEDPVLKQDVETIVKNRLTVDVNLKNVVNKAKVTIVDIGEASNVEVDVKANVETVDNSEFTGVRIGKIGGSNEGLSDEKPGT